MMDGHSSVMLSRLMDCHLFYAQSLEGNILRIVHILYTSVVLRGQMCN